MSLILFWLENFIEKTMVVYCFFNKILSKQAKRVRARYRAGRIAVFFLLVLLPSFAFPALIPDSWKLSIMFPGGFGDPYAPGSPANTSPGYVAPVGHKVAAGVIGVVVGANGALPPSSPTVLPADPSGYNVVVPTPPSVYPLPPNTTFNPAAAAGGGVDVNSTTPVNAAPHPAGVPAAAADAAAANAKAGTLPASANVNTTGHIPSNIAAKAGSAVLFAGSLAALATPAGVLVTLANVVNLGLNGKYLYDAFTSNPSFSVGPNGQVFNSSSSGPCVTQLGSGFCIAPIRDPVTRAITNVASPPAGFTYVRWVSGSGLALNSADAPVTFFSPSIVLPVSNPVPATQADVDAAMLNAINASNTLAAAAVQAALEANQAVQVSNLQSAANVAAIASQWNQISQIVDALGNKTTTLARTVTNIAPAAAVAPTYSPSVQQVTIVNGVPTSQTTINNPAPADPLPVKTQCEKSPDTLGCDSNVVGDVPLEPLTPKDIVIPSLIPYSLSSSYVCPPPVVTFGVGGVMHTFNIWRQPCEVAIGIHPILIACAWLAAAGILVRRI